MIRKGSISVLWDAGKAVVRGILINIASYRKKLRALDEESLVKELLFWKLNINLQDLRECIRKINYIRGKINLLQAGKAAGKHIYYTNVL